MNCKVRINLKNISPYVRKALGLNKGFVQTNTREELIQELAKILAKSKIEKEILFNNAKDGIIFSTDQVGSTEEKYEAYVEQLSQVLEEGKSINAVLTQDVKKLIQTISDKLAKPIDTKNVLISKQMANYFKTIIYDLNTIKQSGLSLDSEHKTLLNQAIKKIKDTYFSDNQVLFFPKYVATVDKAENSDNLYWVTSEFDNLEKGELIEDAFERFTNQKIIDNIKVVLHN